MRLAVCDYVHRSFEHVFDAVVDAEETLRDAGHAAGIPLQVEVGAVRVVAPRMVAVHASWRLPDGTPWYEGEFRILAVNRGSDAVTELLLVGEAAAQGGAAEEILVAWAHRVLAALAAQAVDAHLTATGATAPG